MPLKKAVLSHNTEVIRFMLNNGFAPEPEEELLHLAVSDDHPDTEIVELLLSHCDINHPRRLNGDTPLHLVKSPKLAKMLLLRGADSGKRNMEGKLPWETADVPEVKAALKAAYDENHPVLALPELQPRVAPTDWEKRFSTQIVSIHDLVPQEDAANLNDLRFNYLGNDFAASRRFYTSLAKRMKFSTNIFNFFSPQEVMTRIAERSPDTSFALTFDHYNNTLLGVVDENKKMLPVSLACQIFADDPRIRKISYHDGIWEADLALDELFDTPRAGEYFRKFHICYPVDGVGMPCIYLSMMRQVCQNGAVAKISEFRTDIEINDESGLHLSRLLRSFNNQSGFSAIEERLEVAAATTASVNELLNIDSMLQNHVHDRNIYRKLHNRLEEIAGDPCITYGITSLNNISAKKRSLLPVGCSVNDLLNFCSELTTHHGTLLSNPDAFDVMTGKTLAGELDLEGMYHYNRNSPAFFLDDLDLPRMYTRENREILDSTEVVNG